MRLRDYNYITTILLYPSIMFLVFLKLTNNLKGDSYLYLIIALIIIFIPSFIMSLYSSLDEILHSNKKWRIIFLVLFSIIYLPYYYTKYVSKGEIFFGIIIILLDILFSYLTYLTFNKKVYDFLIKSFQDNLKINENYIYISKNNLFTIDVNKDYRCDNNMGDYVISCDNLLDDSFLGVYSYDITDYEEEEIKDILEYHINQIVEYIENEGYEASVDNDNEIVIINYEKMTIFLSQNNYQMGDNAYSLIFMKELRNDLSNTLEYQKIIESVKFLNYN